LSRAAIIAITSKKGPMTAKQLAAELGLRYSTVRICINRARAHGTKFLVIMKWYGGTPAYGPGPGDDAEGGATGERIIAWLKDGGPSTMRSIAPEIGVSVVAAESAMRRMRKIPGKVHVVRWALARGTGGRESPVFAAGPGRDAKRPDFTNSQRQAEQRYAERRRIARRLAGGATRRPKRPQAATAGPFDALLMR
jgi:predicted ArsR family transcriptional regulator